MAKEAATNTSRPAKRDRTGLIYAITGALLGGGFLMMMFYDTGDHPIRVDRAPVALAAH